MALGSRLGIEIGGSQIWAVRLSGLGLRRAEAMEVEFRSDTLADAVEAMEARLGVATALSVAVDVEALLVKRAQLPPLPLSDRRRMVALEPERFFPVRGEDLVVAVRGDDDLLFAARAELVHQWLAPLERLGPVECVEPAPISLARAFAEAGQGAATILQVASDGKGSAILEVVDGRVRMLRKVFGDVTAAAAVLGADARSDVVYLTPWSDHIADVVSSVLPGTTLKPLPSISGLTPEFSTAYGAALGGGTNGDATLMPREYARRAGARRRRRVVVAATAFVAAFGFAVGSLDYYRTRTVNRLAAGIDVYREQAATVLDLQTEADALSREASRLADVEAQRPNPLLVLETITRLLPTDASVRVLRNSGDEWQLDGFAQDAARLIPVFEESPEFEGVRFRTATSRVRLGSQTYEDYSLVLRYVPAP